MTQWSGKSKGTILGYKIFVYCIKKLGIRAAYSVLVFVAFYYFVAYPTSFKAMFSYFRHRQQFSFFKAVFAVYKSYFTFGQVLIDKIAISAGLRNKFTFDFDGIDILKQLLSEGKGGILISAHIGNFEIAEKFFADIDFNCQIHIVTVDQEHSVIKQYLESITDEKPNVQFIYVKEDMSHIFEINDALSKNHLICFTGDRYFDQSRTMQAELLAKEAHFPAGTFMLASRLKTPVAYVYVMKEPNLHYHLYTRRAPEFKHRDAQAVLNSYTDSVSQMLKKYPYQWFNYFDFWKD
ncbi:Predicted acyltransferase, LPLAT superfamily [Paenimyroides ummariense]|uniref:Predicted acyltransferase, LPLAT superfamily n=1 Tax=Paenimyroides ummariense TaxID=913024 RepID=A0A1I4WYD9_9FLAO|nr:lipid A biosynthesis acyltransferase [Paenimyroides ummariense]SFN18764.1 Predicted acyltransferase, LPLAT superfamily [Paenimyroides ummariense]